jgi:hypothetical protein
MAAHANTVYVTTTRNLEISREDGQGGVVGVGRGIRTLDSRSHSPEFYH